MLRSESGKVNEERGDREEREAGERGERIRRERTGNRKKVIGGEGRKG